MEVTDPVTPAARVSSQEQRVVSLYREYGPAVYRRCLRLLRDREAARDATQEVFVKVLRDIEKLAARDTALPWIYRVATNHCLNLRRDARRHGERYGDDGLEVVPGAPLSCPERFDAQTQAVAVGVLVDGMEHDELASALGISRRTVHRKLTRFLERARALLAGGEP